LGAAAIGIQGDFRQKFATVEGSQAAGDFRCFQGDGAHGLVQLEGSENRGAADCRTPQVRESTHPAIAATPNVL
jgi:hypothetical protein